MYNSHVEYMFHYMMIVRKMIVRGLCPRIILLRFCVRSQPSIYLHLWTTEKRGPSTPPFSSAVLQVESFKFLGVHITNILTWSKHTKTVVKRARQNLFPLR